MFRTAAGVLSCLFVVGAVVPAGAEPVPYGQIVPFAGIGEDGYSGDGHPAVDARIGDEGTISVGPDGTVYLAQPGAGRVRAVRGGLIDTVPGTRWVREPESRLDRPHAAAAGPDGALYVVGDHTVRRVAPDGSATKLADTPVDTPSDIAVDGGGNVYVSGRTFDRATQGDDFGLVVRIDPAGAAAPVVGGGSLAPLAAEGKPATQAHLGGFTFHIAVTPAGVLYVVAPSASYPDHDRASLHRVGPDGTLHTVVGAKDAGFGGDGGPAADAQVSGILGGVDVNGGDVYLYDVGNEVVRVIDERGDITSLAPPVPSGDVRLATSADVGVMSNGDVLVRVGTRVFALPRDGKPPAPPRGHAPAYPAAYPDDEPGTVHTVAGNGHRDRAPVERPGEPGPRRVAVGPDGTRYYTDGAAHRVMKVTTGGRTEVLAGTGAKGSGGDGGPAAKATLDTPAGLAAGPDGSVYVADAGGETLRKVDPRGVITTVARNLAVADVDVAADGGLVVAAGKSVSRIAPDGSVTVLAGDGNRHQEEADGHPAVEASFIGLVAVAVGRDGRVYLLDRGIVDPRPSVRVIDPDGTLRTAAGNAGRLDDAAGFSGDGGPATAAELDSPKDIAVGPDGTLYIADAFNARIRAVAPNGTITTVAGTGERADTATALTDPQSVAVGPDGALSVVNGPGDRIRAVAHGAITDVATVRTGTPDVRGPATGTAVQARGVAVDADGRPLIVEEGRGVSTVERNGTLNRSLADVEYPSAIAVGPDGSRYYVDDRALYRVTGKADPVLVAGGGPRERGVRTRAEDGQPATIASFSTVQDVAVSPAGRPYVATPDAVYRVEADGTLSVAYRGDQKVSGIAVGEDDRLVVANALGATVFEVVDGKATTIAGTSDYDPEDNGDGGAATDASLSGPSDVALDDGGNLYVATASGIRRVDSDGTIMTVTDDTKIGAIATDRHGDLYYVDEDTLRVKVVVQPGRLSNPFPWTMVIWLTIAALAVVAAVVLFLRRRRDRPTPPDSPEPGTEE